jgi:hypothetical protein
MFSLPVGLILCIIACVMYLFKPELDKIDRVFFMLSAIALGSWVVHLYC